MRIERLKGATIRIESVGSAVAEPQQRLLRITDPKQSDMTRWGRSPFGDRDGTSVTLSGGLASKW
jgi:hypothetical protein